MTRKQAEKLGWTFHEGRAPKLIPAGGGFEGYRVLRGFLSAEKTHNALPPRMVRFDVESFELDGGLEEMQARLLRHIADFEAKVAA